MKKKLVATFALLTVTALVMSSNVEAQKYKRMKPTTCPVTGAHYNKLLDLIEKLEKEVEALKKRKPALAAKVGIYVENQKVQVYLARVKWLKAEIARLKQQLAKLLKSDMDPDAKKAAAAALRAKIKKYEAELKALKRKLALLPLRPSARPLVDDAAVTALSKALTGLSAAIDRLVKSGFRAPELEKQLRLLVVAHKITQTQLLALSAEMRALRMQLKKGIKVTGVNGTPSGPLPKWAGWHLTFGVELGYTLLSGDSSYAVPLQGVVCGEYVHRSHLGIEGCMKMGVMFSEAQDDTGAWHHVAPFMFAGSLGGIARWGVFGLNLPTVEAAYIQNRITGMKGNLMVSAFGGVQATISHRVVLRLDLGAGLHTEEPFVGGFKMRFSIKGRF
jgi:hypothetical protein